MKKLFIILCMFTGIYTVNAQQAFEFNGTNKYFTFGVASGLGTNTFTIECWFYRKGTGTSTTTGTGGIGTIIPLVSKGRGEADGSTVDMNYILGINSTTNVLCADFEEGTGQPTPGLNHPVQGTTVIANNTWYHAAVTYDGVKWKLYLNGLLDGSDSINVLPQSLSIQHASIASALTSTGAPAGYFQGIIDEVRIWNFSRTIQQVRDSINKQVTSATGLIGRWAMDDLTSTTLTGTGSSGINGTGVNSPIPVGTGAPYNIVFLPPNNPPFQPTNFVPADWTLGYTDSTLKVTVSDPDTNNMKVIFMGRKHDPIADSPAFTIIPIPDMQFYHAAMNGGTAALAQAQIKWIRDSIKAKNIVYGVQLGDCVQNGDNGGNDIEWKRADTSFKILEDPALTMMTYGLPFGICVGNHDQSPGGSATGTTTFYNQYFGSSRFAGRTYYGGHYGSNNDNHYQLFSASGIDFIAINLEYDAVPDTLPILWADSLLKAYPKRKGIISSHWIINADATWGAQGQAIYYKLKLNPNLTLMLCGHINPNGEARRSDIYNGKKVHTLLSDFQDLTNGGNGWLRIMKFKPADNIAEVATYSPTLNQFQTDANSQFTIDYQMTQPFDTIAIVNNTTSGSSPYVTWLGLVDSTRYDWYVIISDGVNEIKSPVKTFTFKKTPIVVGVNGVEQQDGMLLFPNPNDGKTVTLSYSKQSLAEVSVVDLQGKIIYKDKITIGNHTVLPVMLTSGNYILHVTIEGKNINKKLVVQ